MTFEGVKARWFRLVALSEVTGGNTARIAELSVIAAGFDAWKRDRGKQSLLPDDPVDVSLRFETRDDLLVWSEAEGVVELSSEILDGGRDRSVWSMSLPPEQTAGFARAVYHLR